MGGSSKSVTVGYKYYVGMHMVLCRGPVDYLLQAKVDEKIALAGSMNSGSYVIAQENLFGGESREGGVSGIMDVLGGEITQTANSYLASKIGGLVPAFRGVLSVVFRQMYLGINPYLKKWSFRASRIHVRQNGIEQWYDEKSQINSVTSDAPTWVIPTIDINAKDAGSGAASGIVINASSPTDVIKLTKPSSLVYKAWSAWASDDSVLPVPPPEPGKTWCNRFYVTKNGYSSFYLPQWFATEQEAFEASQSLFPIYLTGATEYTIWLYDDNPGDNRGGFSIRAELFQSFPDMNPAHIIRECLTDPDWGMGYAEADMDEASFIAAADTLYSENMGMSLLWDTQISIEEFVQLVCKHINASIYVDRKTGLFVLKLIRQDYDEADLLVLNPSNVSQVQDFSRVQFGELVNSITVSYWNSSIGDTSTLTVQDIALASTQNATINTSVKYEGFTNSDIASRVAQRDLKALSTPLFSCTVYANTDAANLNIGDCFKLSWPDYDIEEVIMRVATIGYGDGKSNRVRLTCTQDVFAMPDIAYIAPTPPEGVPTDAPPEPVSKQVAFEIPYLEAVQQMGQSVVDGNISTNPDIAYFAMAAGRPSSNSLNARLYTDSGAGYADQSTIDFCPIADLANDIDRLSTSFDISNQIDITQVQFGSWFQIGNEIMEVVSLIGSTVSVKRGLLDTVPVNHLAGETLFFWDLYAGEDSTQYVNGEFVSGKLATVTGSGVLPISAAFAESVTMVGRMFKPYPPGKFQINGEYFPEIVSGDLAFTWAHRDRRQQTGADYVGFLENSIGPEVGTSYNLRIYNEVDTLIRSENSISGTSYSYTNAQEIIDNGGAAGDAYWNNTISLLHFEGADGATSTTDQKSPTWTFAGNAQIDTAIKKFGTSALLLDGNDDNISSTHSDFNLNNSDYTIEGWIYVAVASVTAENTIFSNYPGSDQTKARFIFRVGPNNTLKMTEQDPNGMNDASANSSNNAVPTQTWVHVAFTKQGTSVKGFVNGVQVCSMTSSNRTAFASRLNIGQFDNTDVYKWNFNGSIDDVRVTKGVARYTANFTPPSAPFPDGPTVGRLNGRLRVELESERDGVVSYQLHNVEVKRAGYGFNYGELYGGES